MLDAPAIGRLIPHQGDMCLLDAVEAWDGQGIRAQSARHRDPACPLRRDGRLPTICLVELGLQAMALHGALQAGAPQPPGFVATLADVEIATPWADGLASPLTVEAERLAHQPRGHLYRFRILAGQAPVVSGQALIVIPDAAP